MNLITLTCSQNCYGHDGYHGSCCRMEDRDFIIGKIHDAPELLKRLNEHYGREFAYSDIFIDFEEGSKLFPDKSTWQKPDAYPALRLDLDSPDKRCIFYNARLKACSIYSIRSVTCSRFKCDHLKNKLQEAECNQK